MPINIPGTNLRVFQAPKVLTSSLRYFVFELEYGVEYSKRHPAVSGRTPHQMYPNKLFRREAHLSDSQVCKVALVREPISRFRSAYRDKVSKVRGGPRISAQWVRAEKMGFARPSSADDLVNNFEIYLNLIPALERHTRPQTDWLGEDPAIFDYIYPIHRIGAFQELLSSLLGRPVKIPHRHKSDYDETDSLSEDSLSFLSKFYRSDYEFIDRAEFD